jgi:hypothetical protein
MTAPNKPPKKIIQVINKKRLITLLGLQLIYIFALLYKGFKLRLDETVK